MQAISSHYISPTNTRPGRIKAECERGSITTAWDHGLGVEENHVKAAQALVEKFADEDQKRDPEGSKYHTPRANSPWLRTRITGVLKSGVHVHVFVSVKDALGTFRV